MEGCATRPAGDQTAHEKYIAMAMQSNLGLAKATGDCGARVALAL